MRESERAGAVHGLISTLTLNRAPLLWTAVNRALPRLTHIRSRSTMLRSASSLQASTSQRHAVATAHPSSILRQQTDEDRHAAMDKFAADLAVVAGLLHGHR